jgi:uncharacterized protein (TIGR00251 family)
MSWYRFDAAHGLLTLQVQAQPGARTAPDQPGIEAYGEEAIKVRIAAPAVDGRANQALCELIAARLRVAPGNVQVTRGAGARRKVVTVRIAAFDPALLCSAK